MKKSLLNLINFIYANLFFFLFYANIFILIRKILLQNDDFHFISIMNYVKQGSKRTKT
jgi:hypothetical protein